MLISKHEISVGAPLPLPSLSPTSTHHFGFTSHPNSPSLRFVYTDFDHNRALHRAPSSEIAALAERFGMDLNKWDRATKGKEPAHAPTGRPVLSNRFEADMRQAFTDALFTDVDLISSEGERIPCHKVILCSQSEVLHTMMTVGMIESRRSEIHIQNATTDTLRKVRPLSWERGGRVGEETHTLSAPDERVSVFGHLN